MAMTIILCEYPCGKLILDTGYSDTVTDSANGNSHKNADSSLIGCEALSKEACNSCSEEHC